jgi:broad-specificity NMP kinase
MTVEELEGKLTNIYHEFAETISENETDEQIVARSKEWFVKRLSEETDNKEAIESIANQLVGCLKQASVLSNLEKEKMNKVWMCSGSTYTQVSSGYSVEQSLPVGIYSICLTMTGYHLDRYADKFVFPYKMYGLQNEFIDHVIKTYHATEGNLGIMLTGTKGTGKTVTAKELANKLNLPIIIVKDMGDHNQSMIEFLSGIEGDCILFLDEFEKNFSESDSTILQIMDGVYNSKYRKVFLLTTNAMTINENMVGRPSRIRYVKEFGNLDLKVVNEYLDDALQVPEARQDLLDFIDSLTISTIDILKTIVNEVNIHGIEGLRRAKKVYNACGKFYVPVAGIKANVRYNVPIIRNKALKVCESITDFLDSSKYAKMLKNCTSPYRSRMMQYEYKKENRKDRYKAKRDIQEGIQEYESRDNLSCSSCIFYDKGFCEKGLLMTENCPEYWD